MTHQTGELITSRYRVARLLGQGGMGAVYRGWDLVLNAPVAIKELLPQPGLDSGMLAQQRAQFQQEAQVLANLIHPCLPRVIDFFEFSGNAYLVMDFVEGKSLDQIIEERGRIPEPLARAWMQQLLDALALCHTRNIIHRDIKPQNIIIRTDSRPILVDFGLVKLWDPRNPGTQHIVKGMGTPEYASPEHFGITGHTEPRSDLYSLGATFYHALTGQTPLPAIDRWANPQAFQPLRATGAMVSPVLEAAVLNAMELQPARRFNNATAMTAALRDVDQSGIITPLTTDFIKPIAQPLPGTSWVWEFVTAMLMAVMGVLSFQILLFSAITPFPRYITMSIGALLLGAIGWFVGDTIFQSFTQRSHGHPGTGTVAMPAAGGRPTQKLVAFTQNLTRNLTTGQQVMLFMGLGAAAVAAAWFLGPLMTRMEFLWWNLPSYAFAAPLAYAAMGRKPWRAFLAHLLVTTLGSVALRASTGAAAGIWQVAIVASLGGLLMEGCGFLAEHKLLNRK